MKGRCCVAALVSLCLVLIATSSANAQPVAAAATPASAPAAVGGALRYEVIEVAGDVRVAASGADPKAAQGWNPVKAGDLLQAGQQVSVGIFRSKVKLVGRPADPPTVLLFDRATLIEISELTLSEGVSRSRLKLAYGSVRAGVAETGTRSDMEIAMPVATLSKKGTDIFQVDYHDGHYYIGLTEQGRGLLQTIQTQSTAFGSRFASRTRSITPGQWITHQIASAIDNVQMDANVSVNDLFGVQGLDQLFTLMNDHGLGFLLPQGTTGNNVLQPPSTAGGPPANLPASLGSNLQGGAALLLAQGAGGLRLPPAGSFGVGQGELPDIFGTERVRASRLCLPNVVTGCTARPGMFRAGRVR